MCKKLSYYKIYLDEMRFVSNIIKLLYKLAILRNVIRAWTWF